MAFPGFCGLPGKKNELPFANAETSPSSAVQSAAVNPDRIGLVKRLAQGFDLFFFRNFIAFQIVQQDATQENEMLKKLLLKKQFLSGIKFFFIILLPWVFIIVW